MNNMLYYLKYNLRKFFETSHLYIKKETLTKFDSNICLALLIIVYNMTLFV